MTRLHLCQSSSARCTRRCLRRNGRSGIGGVSEAAGRESPPHRESATSARPARTRQSQGGPIRPHCSRPLPQAHSHCRNFAHQSAHLPSRFLLSHQSATSHQHPLSLAGPSRRQSKVSRPPSLPNTESSLISSQRYVKRNSLAALIKHITRSQITSLESVPITRSPCRIPAPPLHHFIDHRFEDLQMANNRRRTRKKRTKPSRRMSFLCNVLQIDCRLT